MTGQSTVTIHFQFMHQFPQFNYTAPANMLNKLFLRTYGTKGLESIY